MQVLRVVHGVQRKTRTVEQGQPVFTQAEGMRAAVEQPCAQVLLQRGHLFGHRWLAHTQLACGRRKAAAVGNADKHLESGQHIHSR